MDKGIRSIYNPSDEEKDKIKFIYDDRYRAMKDSKDRQDLMKKMDKFEKQYEAFREDRRKDKWQSNHVVLTTFAVIETALSEITKQNIRPIILPRGKEDESKAKIMQYVWDYAWECSNGDLAMYNILKDALMFGTGIGQEYYWQDKRKVQTSKVVGKKEEKGEEEMLAYDDCFLEVVKLQDFFVDEKARGFSGIYAARDCIRRYIMSIDDFNLFFSGDTWNPLGNAKYVRPGGDTNFYEFYKPPTGIDQSKEVEVLWYWSTKPKDRFVVVANDVLIRDGANPYQHKQLPFVRCLDVKRVHKFYGKGEAEILESTQDEQTTTRRMMIDRNHLDIDKMFFVSRNASLSDEDLIARPHGMIPTDDVNSAKAVEYGDVPRSVELGLKYLEDDATIGTGINPRAQAMPTAGTATEAAILKESTLRRIEMKIWMMKKEFLVEMAKLRVANILQFYPQPKLEKVIGSENEQMYKDQQADLEARGLLTKIGGEEFVKQYKQIRLEGEQMQAGEKGDVSIASSSGFSFFDLKPEYFVPVTKGGYDIKFDATSNIDISKPLMQSKSLELFDRFSQIALNVPGSYDIVKLGDMVLVDFDKNPANLKPAQASQDPQAVFLQNQINIASMENKQMLQGNPLPATPYASPIHTRVHVEFMQGEEFQKAPEDIDRLFTEHVIGEIAAQTMREQTGSPGAGGVVPAAGLEPTPTGQTTPGGAANGVTNRGVAATNIKPQDVMGRKV